MAGKQLFSCHYQRGPHLEWGWSRVCPETVAGDVAGAEVGDMIGTAAQGWGAGGARMGDWFQKGSWTGPAGCQQAKAASEAAAAEAEALGAAQCVWVQNKGSGRCWVM